MNPHQLLPLLVVPAILTASSLAGLAQNSGLPTQPLLQVQAATTEEADRQARAEELIQAFADESYERVRQLLDPHLQALWSAEKLESLWQELIQQSGPVAQIVSSGITTGPISTAAPVCVEFATVDRDCSDPKNIFVVTFNPDGDIVGVNFPKFQTRVEIAGQFALELSRGDFAAARGEFSSEFKAERFPEQLAAEWRALEQRWGAFQSIGSVRENDSEGISLSEVTVVEVEIRFANRTVPMLVLFDGDRRIVQYLFPDL